MNIDDSRLIVRFQRLITEMLVEKQLGQRRPELTDELYQTWREVGRRGLKETPEYRDVLLRVDRHALWLAGLVRLAARPVSSPEIERTDTLDAPQSTPCIITVAITGSVPQKSDNPAVPITINEQIESTHAAFEAGATIAHLHVRKDDGTPSSDPDRFAALQVGLRQHCPGMIVQFSTGGRSGKGSERGGMLVHRPDMASLSTGSCNFPSIVYENHPERNHGTP
jgi:hypothetical protein